MKIAPLAHHRYFDYEQSPGGELVIRRSPFRWENRRMYLFVVVITMTFAPWVIVRGAAELTQPEGRIMMWIMLSAWAVAALLITAISIRLVRNGPPTMTFDPKYKTLVMNFRPDVPFNEIDGVHVFERKEKEKNADREVEMFKDIAGALEERSVFEVYVRLGQERVVLGEFDSEGRAESLAAQTRRVLETYDHA